MTGGTFTHVPPSGYAPVGRSQVQLWCAPLVTKKMPTPVDNAIKRQHDERQQINVKTITFCLSDVCHTCNIQRQRQRRYRERERARLKRNCFTGQCLNCSERSGTLKPCCPACFSPERMHFSPLRGVQATSTCWGGQTHAGELGNSNTASSS